MGRCYPDGGEILPTLSAIADPTRVPVPGRGAPLNRNLWKEVDHELGADESVPGRALRCGSSLRGKPHPGRLRHTGQVVLKLLKREAGCRWHPTAGEEGRPAAAAARLQRVTRSEIVQVALRPSGQNG